MSNLDIFIPRLSAPSLTDLNYISHYSPYNGYNYCIVIDTTSGYVMPNCTGYCWGRWREVLNEFHNLSRSDATNWFGNTSDGYDRGSTPKLMAVACWSGGSGGEGHVAIVEEIRTDGILCSESAYNSYMFRTNLYDLNMTKSGYTFQGFIYFPNDLMDLNQLISIMKRKKGRL